MRVFFLFFPVRGSAADLVLKVTPEITHIAGGVIPGFYCLSDAGPGVQSEKGEIRDGKQNCQHVT